MARFRTDGLDDLMREMLEMGEDTGPIADRILLAGAEVIRRCWKIAAESHGHRDTGDMIGSINYAKKPKKIGDLKAVDIYPQGKNRRKVRNAEVAFILHYGSSKIPGSHWIDDADDMSEPEVEQIAYEIWNEELRKRGL